MKYLEIRLPENGEEIVPLGSKVPSLVQDLEKVRELVFFQALHGG